MSGRSNWNSTTRSALNPRRQFEAHREDGEGSGWPPPEAAECDWPLSRPARGLHQGRELRAHFGQVHLLNGSRPVDAKLHI